MNPHGIVTSIVVAIAGLGGAAYLDERREEAAALVDFAHEQASLAREAAAALQNGASGSTETVSGTNPRAISQAFAPIDKPGEVIALFRTPGFRCLGERTHTDACLPRLEQAMDESGCSVDTPLAGDGCSLQLTHEESASLGLPPRMAMAGIATFTSPDARRWEVAVVATAERERDRQRRAATRLVLSFIVSSGLVLAFGTLALRKQRRELALEAARAMDERLVREGKLATLGALATGIAHEVATPLGVIVGRAEQLEPKVQGDERASRSVAAILEQATRIGEVIRAFLSLARGGTPSLENTPPRLLASAAVELVAHRFAQAGVEVDYRSDDQAALPQVACDRRLVEQALVNLLLNACDACEAGGHVLLEVHQDGDHVAFVVTDDGTGITPEAAARATEPFFTTKPEGKGTGLGLAITREIVQHHRGTLSVSPRRGAQGTEARIALPAPVPPEGAA